MTNASGQSWPVDRETLGTVLVLEPHSILRRSLCGAIERAPNLTVVGETGSADLLLGLASALRPQVALVSLGIWMRSALNVCRDMSTAALTAVVLLAWWDHDACISRAWTAGATAILGPGSQPAELTQVLGCARAGHRLFDPDQIRRALTWHRLVAVPMDRLTPRELEVLRHLVKGATNRAIARHLGVCEKTVEYHVGSIFSKLQLLSRREVTVWVTDTAALDGI